MAGVYQHRQVGGPLQHGDGGHVQSGTGGGHAAAYTALTQDDLLVAAGEQVLRCQQEFLHRGGEAALQQHGAAQLAQRFQQRIVLHIAGTDLQHVHIGQQIQLGGIGDLRYHRQARIPARLHQQIHAGLFQTLEGVGRGAGLEGAAPQQLGAGLLHRLGHRGHLGRGLHGAGPCDHAEFFTDFCIAHGNHGIGGVGGAARQTIGGGETAHLLHVGEPLEHIGVETPRVAHQRKKDAVGTGDAAALDVLGGQLGQKLANGRLRRSCFDNDDHVCLLKKYLGLLYRFLPLFAIRQFRLLTENPESDYTIL